MQHFPVFLDLQARPVLVLGAGEVAERKADLLRQAGAEIRFAVSFDAALLEGCALAIGADAPESELQALATACRARGIPVNVVDRPALCTALMPAIIDRAPVTIAVSSGGAAPVLARMIRQKIEALLPPGLGRVAALAERFKSAVRARLPDLAARRRFLDATLGGLPADLAIAGREAEADSAFATALDAAETRPRGMVHLVGAGPGAADLLTLRALRLLGEADVIVHDRLGTEAVLEMARRDAERIFVGKARANHCMKQEDINALLIRLAHEGRRVVRLKGGDPLVFGRGGEEAEALAAAGIPCEVVPGVTAALACAAGAGIPLTHRDAARAVTFVTGHRRDGGVDVRGLVQPGQTLAIYMGISTLAPLRDGLVAEGMAPTMPAAVIERGGTPEQRVLRGTLDSIAAEAPGWVTGGPALLLVGEAVGRGAQGWLQAA
ncbi:siroheme synthase CysG [Belnapia rosea]|uniref:siroheme synthase CysG n=1 Tax=Belnapia rosea TaxID=938405 RepID=UPI000886CEC6|nr:siroheme synthase CysG [Belnapia rosea]SDB54008.1 uroporphyrin-III C-methyltransferase / precorrin-2 dehydrogenase / sirohydrochlorin ferrochelatase [Belnapia rosea]